MGESLIESLVLLRKLGVSDTNTDTNTLNGRIPKWKIHVPQKNVDII